MRDFGSLEVTDADPPEETYGSVFQINVVFDGLFPSSLGSRT